MRKSVFLVLALLLIIGGTVFAQDMSKPSVAITAWGRGIFLPVISGGGDAMSVAGVSWGAAPRVGYTIAGSTDNVGFQVDLTNDSSQTVSGNLVDSTGAELLDGSGNPYSVSVTVGAPGWGDQQKIWFKPISQIELQIGRIYDDTLRGSASFGAWNWLRYASETGDGDIFARVGEYGQANFELSITPVDGAYIFAGFGGNGNSLLASAVTVSSMFENGQYGAGYTIQNIGTIRAQYIGAGSNGTINAAFKLSAVPGLTLDVGGFIPTISGGTPVVAAYVSYAMDALTVSAMGRFQLASGSTGIEGGLDAAYTVDKASNIGVEADVRFLNGAAYDGTNSEIGFLLGLTKGFSNGVLGIGFEGSTGDFAGGWTGKAAGSTSFAWAVPIRMEYWF